MMNAEDSGYRQQSVGSSHGPSVHDSDPKKNTQQKEISSLINIDIDASQDNESEALALDYHVIFVAWENRFRLLGERNEESEILSLRSLGNKFVLIIPPHAEVNDIYERKSPLHVTNYPTSADNPNSEGMPTKITWADMRQWLHHYKSIVYTTEGNIHLSQPCPLTPAECMHIFKIDEIFNNSGKESNDLITFDINVSTLYSFLKEVILVTLHRPSPHASISFTSPPHDHVFLLTYDQVDRHEYATIEFHVELNHWQQQKDGLWRISTDNSLDEAILVGDVIVQSLDIHLNHSTLLIEKGYQKVRIYAYLIYLNKDMNDLSFWNDGTYIDIYFKIED